MQILTSSAAWKKGHGLRYPDEKRIKKAINGTKYLLMIRARLDTCRRNMLTLSIRKEIQQNEKRQRPKQEATDKKTEDYLDFIHRNLCFDDSGNDMRSFRA